MGAVSKVGRAFLADGRPAGTLVREEAGYGGGSLQPREGRLCMEPACRAGDSWPHHGRCLLAAISRHLLATGSPPLLKCYDGATWTVLSAGSLDALEWSTDPPPARGSPVAPLPLATARSVLCTLQVLLLEEMMAAASSLASVSFTPSALASSPCPSSCSSSTLCLD